MRVMLKGKGVKKQIPVPSRLRLKEDRVDPKGLALNPYERGNNAARGEARKGPVHVTYHLKRKAKRLMRGTSASTSRRILRVEVGQSVAALAT